MNVKRRDFLLSTGAAGLAVSVAGATDALFTANPAAGAAGPATGYGDLVPDPKKILDLPRGFSYRILSREGQPLPSGEGVTPSRFDGMGHFPAPGRRTVLVRNHECYPDAPHPVPGPKELTYDPGAGGGTTTLEVGHDGKVFKEYVSLRGTAINCSGGTTPWRTWLTCEETEDKAGTKGYEKDHGFVFEVDPYNNRHNTKPVALKEMGRFQHEAAIVDPWTGIVYETEDAFVAPLGGYYRFLPNRPLGGRGSLRAGGKLQAMRVPGLPDLSVVQEAGAKFGGVTWVDVPDPLAKSESVRKQDFGAEITRGYKLEGAWWGKKNNCAYFVSSFARRETGSAKDHDGQVWRYDPRRHTITLEFVFTRGADAPADPVYEAPDALCVSPYGGLIICEDGGGENYLLGTTRSGEVFLFGRNRQNIGTAEKPEFGEMAGLSFSEDGRTLFFNCYTPGTTFAVTGPWRRT